MILSCGSDVTQGLYTAYTRYNYKTGKLEGKLIDQIPYDDMWYLTYLQMNGHLLNMEEARDRDLIYEKFYSGLLDTSKLDTIKLIYKLDKTTGEYSFSELIK